MLMSTVNYLRIIDDLKGENKNESCRNGKKSHKKNVGATRDLVKSCQFYFLNTFFAY